MNKQMIITALFACLLLLLPVCMAAENSIGKIIAIEGQAKAIGPNGRERPLALKSEVFMNDRIITAVGAKLQISFNDDTMISQGEKSEMTIDQYVYNPKAGGKDDNCSFRMAKGIFRTITGKITAMNPERFKVKTNLATIGIRGCELGLRLQKNKEDIYVLDLPPGHSILIEKIIADETGRGGIIGTADRILNIVNAGVAVTISPTTSLTERPVPTSESMKLIRDSTPSKSAGTDNEIKSNDINSNGSSLRQTIDENVRTRDQTAQGQAMLAQSKQILDQMAAAARPAEQHSDLQTFTQPTTAPYVPPPAVTMANSAGSPMNDWHWGLWADGTVQVTANTDFGASFLPASEYKSIVAATPSRLLTGSGGIAGAVVTASGGYKNTSLVDMNVLFEIMIGYSATPGWGATFNLAGGGDSLSFVVDRASGKGTINNNGVLSLKPAIPFANYTLSVNGSTLHQDTLTAQSMNGTMVKPSGGTSPSGVAGSFSFQHSSGASASGAYGINLN